MNTIKTLVLLTYLWFRALALQAIWLRCVVVNDIHVYHQRYGRTQLFCDGYVVNGNT